MKSFRATVFAVALALGSTAPALAGSVQVNSTWATGDMGTSHNAGGSQFIGCWVSTDTAGPALLYCEANAGGTTQYCYSTNTHILNTLQTMTTVAEISFGWDGAHGCTWLMINTHSQHPGRSHP